MIAKEEVVTFPLTGDKDLFNVIRNQLWDLVPDEKCMALAHERVGQYKGREKMSRGEDGQEAERESVKMLTGLACEPKALTANLV